MKLNVLFLGKCEYEKALKIQYELLRKRQNNEIEDTLILVEHPPVITLGRRAQKGHILKSKEFLKKEGIDVFQINRGGDVTYHGDGQIVGYPIIHLKSISIGIRNFVNNLEELFIQLLYDKYHIVAGRDPKHTGVWVGEQKIVAIGLAVKRGVTMHGFAFNVNTNLDHFKWIIPCGIENRGVTSIQNMTEKNFDFQKANQFVFNYFLKIFHYETYKEVTLDQLLLEDRREIYESLQKATMA
ncbi:lipoyl(octanoyl) transferase LipB [Inediibacterium massiliense]|uniref:lipoyl(octanoyl) transferase LipB n=1 Tax=Inediibacterium massiliense TaxID=1658111 RepID=UPI0006B5E812|nr:lipoyl(octanoyl) transferase LipB [Inediibacterium massiliense]